MTLKRLFIILSIFVMFGIGVFLFFSDSRTALVKRVFPTSQNRSETRLLRLHPLASDAALKATHTHRPSKRGKNGLMQGLKHG